MGLDMMLYAMTKDDLMDSDNKFSYDQAEEVAYWRKVNSIHKWFVDNVQNGKDDCGDYEVERSKLQSLVDLIDQVLNDKSLAGQLLPPQDGFFFGTTEINEVYFSDLETTKRRLSEILKMPDDMAFYYTSSW